MTMIMCMLLIKASYLIVLCCALSSRIYSQQTARNSVNRDDWFGRWLLDKPQQVTPINAGNIPYKDKNKNKEKEKEIPDRRISMHERTEYERTDVKKR